MEQNNKIKQSELSDVKFKVELSLTKEDLWDTVNENLPTAEDITDKWRAKD